MRGLLAGLLLLCLGQLTWAQGASAPPAPSAFEIDIEAPDPIRQLLLRHLELARYREQSDLSETELQRLGTAAQGDSRELLATQGYFSPQIELDLQTAPARRVRLRITPGEPTLVQDVQLNFQGAIADDPAARAQRQQIEARWSLRPGMRFTQADWDTAKQQTLVQLTTQRFAAGQLRDTLADIDPASHSARLSLTLDSGPAYRLGELLVSGAQRHEIEQVARLARLTPGSEYSQSALAQAQQRLADSGWYDSVFLTLEPSGDPGAAPVRVQLREAPLQKVVFGLGASTDSGARLSLEHTHHKVPVIGWRAVSKLSLDRETSALGSEWMAPANDSNWRWVGSVLLQNQRLDGGDVSSQRLRWGRSQSGELIERDYFLQYDRAQAAGGAGTEVSEALSANLTLTRHNFDSQPFPSRGWGAGLELGGGTTLGSPQHPYGRLLARWRSYHPLERDGASTPSAARASRLVLRAQAGAVLAPLDSPLPSTQLFLTGGDNSVRGYGYHDIGVTRPDGQTAAGRYLMLGSIEWQRPIQRQNRLTDWESTLFLDGGAVADQASELRAHVGIGAGLRWKSPVGPLQMDLAYGVQSERLRLHLNVGFSF